MRAGLLGRISGLESCLWAIVLNAKGKGRGGACQRMALLQGMEVKGECSKSSLWDTRVVGVCVDFADQEVSRLLCGDTIVDLPGWFPV